MPTTLTKLFRFSASFERNGHIHGHNYILGITLDALDENSEILLEKKINHSLISKMESKDLGLHVDFLKGVPITDTRLLDIFWDRIVKEIEPWTLHALSLERDSKTRIERS